MDAVAEVSCVRFGKHLLDAQAGELFRLDNDNARVSIPIGSRALEVLSVLLAHPGELVLKQTIMDAVWSNTAVEESNLTVQISALRRALDTGSAEGSLIQTVPGRGYRFVPPVTRTAIPPEPAHARALVADPAPKPPRRRWLMARLGVVCGVLLLVAAAWRAGWLVTHEPPPRLSIAVLPFENLSGDRGDDYLAEGITDDLTSDLAHLSGAFVIARQSASIYKGKPRDVRKIGEDLGVRYVLEGSVRRLGPVLRVNAQLVSGETGAQLWSDRFDEQISQLAVGQEQIVSRMRSELGVSMIEIEKARSLRERPTNPDAFDLVLRARSILFRPPTKERQDEALALLEQALVLDSQSVHALATIAFLLIEKSGYPSWPTFDTMQRVERLLTQARSIAPGSEVVLNYTVQWLRWTGRYQEAMAVAEELVARFPNNPAGFFDLAQSKTMAGHAEEAIPLSESAIRLDPQSPWLFNRYRDLGVASLLLGRDEDAVRFLERSLSINPHYYSHQWTYRFLAAAYARTGRPADAKRALSEGDRLFPYDTVRSHWPDNPSSAVFAEQIRQMQDALRLAGERDHADEDADFNVPADAELRSYFAGLTPTSAPGTKTIHTTELAGFLVEFRPVVIDTVSYSWGRSMPGAIGLKLAGMGGSFTDTTQDRLRSKMRELTGNDLSRPIVAVGWNSERFDGRNLALRLAALGYSNVYWYRGGREAWEVNGLPETKLDVQTW
jgi:TolB-like protein/DNA-binding winged helix-turn-helix (wHTH) protein/Flp pilus assembly protein TadD/rhodanese-related sulfurtransferase